LPGRREQTIKVNIGEFDGFTEPFADFVDQIDLEADDIAALILKLPGYVTDIDADREIGGNRSGTGTEQYRCTQQ
jgi:hypothetical protein